MEFAPHLITVPQNESDMSFERQFNYICNSFKHHYGETCELVVVGETAFNCLAEDSRFMEIVDTLPTRFMMDSELPPMGGYACVMSRLPETTRVLRFIKK